MYTAFTCFLKILFLEIKFVSNQCLGIICTKPKVRAFRDGGNAESRDRLWLGVGLLLVDGQPPGLILGISLGDISSSSGGQRHRRGLFV